MDIKLVQHAKDYIDDLANGVNPLTKENVDDNDIVNNVKISRCLFYVSSVLNEVIENGGTKKPAKAKELPFSVDSLNLDNIELSQTPVSVSVIASSINELKPDDMKKLKATAITNWLVDIKMLELVTINNRNVKRPTAEGRMIGITDEQRQGQYGSYTVVCYNEDAQRFIIDNLNVIIDGGYNGQK